VGRGKIETPIHGNEVRRESKIYHFILAAESLCLGPYRVNLIRISFYHQLYHLSILVPILVPITLKTAPLKSVQGRNKFDK
jgi:hypothetical protein